MSRTQWHQRGDTRSADILGYTAIIRDLGGGGYRAHIEGPDGSTLCDWPDAFPSLEQAEEWARFCAVDMEQAASADPARVGMLATLDLCRAALGEQAHPAHIQWIACIRRWVIDHANDEVGDAPPPPAPVAYELDWREEAPGRFTAATPHGTAVIVERRGERSPYRVGVTIQHHASIQHPSGAAYPSSTFLDFVDAETWLRSTLEKIDDPRLMKSTLDSMEFILEICARSLPPEADATHRSRITYLAGRIVDAIS